MEEVEWGRKGGNGRVGGGEWDRRMKEEKGEFL